jgi:hypothetical protein
LSMSFWRDPSQIIFELRRLTANDEAKRVAQSLFFRACVALWQQSFVCTNRTRRASPPSQKSGHLGSHKGKKAHATACGDGLELLPI